MKIEMVNHPCYAMRQRVVARQDWDIHDHIPRQHSTEVTNRNN